MTKIVKIDAIFHLCLPVLCHKNHTFLVFLRVCVSNHKYNYACLKSWIIDFVFVVFTTIYLAQYKAVFQLEKENEKIRNSYFSKKGNTVVNKLFCAF